MQKVRNIHVHFPELSFYIFPFSGLLSCWQHVCDYFETFGYSASFLLASKNQLFFSHIGDIRIDTLRVTKSYLHIIDGLITENRIPSLPDWFLFVFILVLKLAYASINRPSHYHQSAHFHTPSHNQYCRPNRLIPTTTINTRNPIGNSHSLVEGLTDPLIAPCCCSRGVRHGQSQLATVNRRIYREPVRPADHWS